MTKNICNEYLELIKSMNYYDSLNEDCPMGIQEEFHYHISTCVLCKERVFYDSGMWQYSTDEGTKCQRCGSPPGYFCRKGCEELEQQIL